jgi:hypothetical protein
MTNIRTELQDLVDRTTVFEGPAAGFDEGYYAGMETVLDQVKVILAQPTEEQTFKAQFDNDEQAHLMWLRHESKRLEKEARAAFLAYQQAKTAALNGGK